MPIAVNDTEEKVVQLVRASSAELIALVSELVSYDTTARSVGEPARDEVKFQAALAARLRAIGAQVDIWEPEPTGAGNRFVPDGLDFKGRPQLAGRLSGSGGGRSLLLNGHIDAVTPGPLGDWASDPFVVSEREGCLWGRGVNDMKGGLASMLLALELLHRAGIRLRGDVVYCANTDEESSGAGSLACVAHGVKADAGICAEPTGFDVWVACRGTVMPIITVPGRAGHAEMPHPHWREGGAVNAIDKLVPILTEVRRLNEDWRARSDQRHPFLSAGDIVPVLVDGGTWDVTYPAFCHLTLDCHYLPAQWHPTQGADLVKAEIRQRIDAAAATDDWLAAHPIGWQWEWEVPPAEIAADHPLVTTVLESAAALARPSRPGGLNSWHDAATFTLHGGIPTFSYGPGGGDTAHAVNECVAVDDLVDLAAIVAVAVTRWCGVAGS
jgi:acetylornithine deacetylase